ncbi:MAG: DUF3795 domain-containing protein [bacterium]
MKPEELITYCGLYGGHCARWQGYPHFRGLARELAEWLESMGCGYWMPHTVGEFNYTEFKKGLDFFADDGNWFTCTKCCHHGDGYPECPVRKCAIEKGVELCFDCAEFPCDVCRPFFDIEERAREYRELGRRRWLARQLEFAEQGYELHTRKCYGSPVRTSPSDSTDGRAK